MDALVQLSVHAGLDLVAFASMLLVVAAFCSLIPLTPAHWLWGSLTAVEVDFPMSEAGTELGTDVSASGVATASVGGPLPACLRSRRSHHSICAPYALCLFTLLHPLSFTLDT